MKFVPSKFQSFRVTCATFLLVASTSYIHKIFYLCDATRARCDPKLLLFHSVHAEAYYVRAILSPCIQSRTMFLLFSQILYYVYIRIYAEGERERRGKAGQEVFEILRWNVQRTRSWEMIKHRPVTRIDRVRQTWFGESIITFSI